MTRWKLGGLALLPVLALFLMGQTTLWPWAGVQVGDNATFSATSGPWVIDVRGGNQSDPGVVIVSEGSPEINPLILVDTDNASRSVRTAFFGGGRIQTQAALGILGSMDIDWDDATNTMNIVDLGLVDDPDTVATDNIASMLSIVADTHTAYSSFANSSLCTSCSGAIRQANPVQSITGDRARDWATMELWNGKKYWCDAGPGFSSSSDGTKGEAGCDSSLERVAGPPGSGYLRITNGDGSTFDSRPQACSRAIYSTGLIVQTTSATSSGNGLVTGTDNYAERVDLLGEFAPGNSTEATLQWTRTGVTDEDFFVRCSINGRAKTAEEYTEFRVRYHTTDNIESGSLAAGSFTRVLSDTVTVMNAIEVSGVIPDLDTGDYIGIEVVSDGTSYDWETLNVMCEIEEIEPCTGVLP